MRTTALLPLAAPLLLTACEPRPMSAAEQVDAVQLSVETARMDAATNDLVEVTTTFTLGQAVDAARDELRAFWESQAPCATVEVEPGTVIVDFGTSEGCSWNGRVWTGQSRIELVSVGEGEAEVQHTWTALSNGVGTLDGTAVVTWSAEAASRNVVVDATWVGPEFTIEVDSDRTIARLEPGGGPGTGIVVDGFRSWAVDGAVWEQTIDGVEMRAQDPAPQAGTFTLLSPAGRQASLDFERVDDDTIRVTLSARRVRTWLVTSAGVAEE